MLRFTATNAVISRGFDNRAALKYSEDGNVVRFRTGEIIERHPDAVVIVTTNISYEGCRGLNQSIIDRMSLVQDIELPAPEVMVQRAMSVTGATDEYQVSQMVQVVNDMSDYCRKNSITDGAVGMRSLLDWIVITQITGDPYQSALYTVISKATADEADREALISSTMRSPLPCWQSPGSFKRASSVSSRTAGAVENRPAFLWAVGLIPTRCTVPTARSSARTIFQTRSQSLRWACCWMNPVPCGPATAALTPEPRRSSSMISVRVWTSR